MGFSDTRRFVIGPFNLIWGANAGRQQLRLRRERSRVRALIIRQQWRRQHGFGHINSYRPRPFVFDAMQGLDDDCRAAEAGEADPDLSVQFADHHMKQINNR